MRILVALYPAVQALQSTAYHVLSNPKLRALHSTGAKT
jgi:hypothetical protein